MDPSTTSLDTDGSHDSDFYKNFDVKTTNVAEKTIFETEVPVGGVGLSSGIGGTVIKT